MNRARKTDKHKHFWRDGVQDKHHERKFSPKRKFWAGHPFGRPAKNFGQALQSLEKQACRNGHPTRTSMKKLRSEKLRAGFSFPKTGTVPGTNRDPSPGTNWDPPLGQIGRFLLNSTVKSPFFPVCPWDGWGFVSRKGRQKNVCVFVCLLVFFSCPS